MDHFKLLRKLNTPGGKSSCRRNAPAPDRGIHFYFERVQFGAVSTGALQTFFLRFDTMAFPNSHLVKLRVQGNQTWGFEFRARAALKSRAALTWTHAQKTSHLSQTPVFRFF